MTEGPSTNGRNGGRDARGRFTRGCSGGPGNPHSRRVAKLRSALLESVTAGDLAAVARKLVAMARKGDISAAKLVLERLLGPPVPLDVMQEIEDLKAEVERITQ